MPEENGVHCHYQQGIVTLTCDQEAFTRLVAVVGAAAGPAAAVPAVVNMVVVKRIEPSAPPTPWLDALGWMGCAVAAATVILLLGAGAYTLSKWVWGP